MDSYIFKLTDNFIEHLSDADYTLRLRILKYSFPEWKCMVDTLIDVARKLCELRGKKNIFWVCLPIMTNLSFPFREDEMRRWNVGSFVLFLERIPQVHPEMAFILFRLIDWVVEYPGFVQFFKQNEHSYRDLCHSFRNEDGKEQRHWVTGRFFNTLIEMNAYFKQVLPVPVPIRTSFFGTRLKLCRIDVPRFLIVSEKKRQKMMVISGISSKLIQKIFQSSGDSGRNEQIRLMILVKKLIG